jgi:hypothetical protein
MVTRKALFTLAAAALGIAAVSTSAKAITVNNPVPDVYSDFTTVTYTVSGGVGTFTATGFAEHLRTDPTDSSITQNIPMGNFVMHGSFALSGNNISSITSADVKVSNDPTSGPSTTYFHSTHLASITPNGGTLTFHFTSGDGNYPGAFDVILHSNSTYNFVDFGHAFANTGNGAAFSDTVSVPEPASLGVLALGGLVLVRRRRAAR